MNETNTVLTQSLDTIKSRVTGSITGKECKETDKGAVALYKIGKDKKRTPVLKGGKQVFVEFAPFQFDLEIDWTGYGDVNKWLSQFVNSQAAIRWANKVRPHGLDYVTKNQKINAAEFFVKQIGIGGDPATVALNKVDKIDDLDDLDKLLEAVKARKAARLASQKAQ